MTPALGTRLIKGVELEDGLAKIDKFQIVQTTPQASLVEIELHEGRNRIVRRIFDEVGYPVTQLVRTPIGPIRLGDLGCARWDRRWAPCTRQWACDAGATRGPLSALPALFPPKPGRTRVRCRRPRPAGLPDAHGCRHRWRDAARTGCGARTRA